MNTNTTFFNTDTPQTIIDVLDYLNDDLKVDQMQISPAYAYEKAPDQEHFLGVEETRELFRKAFGDGRRKKWRLNHTPLFLDFLEGKTDFGCTAWGIPSYSLLGWQKPCYLMNDGYVKTYKELIETDRLGFLRAGQGPALRQLHGALRLRALGRAGHDELAARVDQGDAQLIPSHPFPRVPGSGRGPAFLLPDYSRRLRSGLVQVAGPGSDLARRFVPGARSPRRQYSQAPRLSR